MNHINPAQCPICKEPNACAMEVARTTGKKAERCWCFDADFSAEVMAQIPDDAKNKACVCAQCAALF